MGFLWIKASGKWLAHAMREDVLVPVELAEVRESIQKNTRIEPRFAQKDVTGSRNSFKQNFGHHSLVLVIQEMTVSAGWSTARKARGVSDRL